VTKFRSDYPTRPMRAVTDLQHLKHIDLEREVEDLRMQHVKLIMAQRSRERRLLLWAAICAGLALALFVFSARHWMTQH